MGNNSGKLSSKTESSHEDGNTVILTNTFNEHSKLLENNIKYIDESGFIKGLFCKVPSFGKYLYQKTSKDSQHVDLYAFIKMSNQFSCPSLMNSFESQIELYLNIFSVDSCITLHDYSELVRAAMDGSRAIARMGPSGMPFDKALTAFINTPFNELAETEKKESEVKGAFSSVSHSTKDTDSISNTTESTMKTEFLILYLKSKLPNIFKDLHDHVVYRLFKRTHFKKQLPIPSHTSQPVESSLVEACGGEHSLLGFPSLWLISLFCPLSFIPHSDTGNTSNLSRVVENNAWHVLYNSNSQGLSSNGFLSRISGYPGSSIMFIKFAQNLLAIGSDVEWKESGSRRGGYDSFLLQLLPSFKLLQGGKNESIFFNINNRTVKKALQYYGQLGKVEVEVDEGMSSVMYHGQNCYLDCIEVWGCGGSSRYDSYVSQKLWEKKDTQKHTNRKLKVDDWNDSPDKVLLGYGGIETDHAKRGDV